MTMHIRAANFTPSTWDDSARTIEAVISTFADVTRNGFTERLDSAGLDTSALIGAPVLDGHKQGSARDAIGVVTAFRFESGALVATVRLTNAPDAQPVIHRILDSTISGVSIGYRVAKWKSLATPSGPIRTAIAWSISEISAVPIPADAGARFRSLPMENTETNEPNVVQTRAAIRTIARAANLPATWADEQIDSNATEVEVRAAAFEAMQTRTRNTPIIRTVAPSAENPAEMRRHREDALYSRINGGAPSEQARPFMAESLRDMARASVEATGVNTRGMDSDQLFRAAMHTTSDFPQLLTGVGNRTLIAAYQTAESPLKKMLARQTTMTDFRMASRLKLSDGGLLEKVSETGEIKHTTRGEASESYALDTYGSMFAISRKALINDDLGAFRDWGLSAGRASAETEANLLWNMLKANPKMGEDAKAIFHVDHGNVLSAAALDVAALSEARKALRGMKALDGKTPINATPKYLVVGPELETKAEQVLAAIYAASVTDSNPFTGKLTLLVEPRITDERWYVFADPAQMPVLEYAYLASAQGPQMASREGWDVLGMEFRVVLDFGCGLVDWRGAILNEDSV